MRESTAEAVCSAFSYLPDKNKQEAWNDLIKLASDEDIWVRRKATASLGSTFSYLLDKDKQDAWNDLIKLAINNDIWFMSMIGNTLVSSFIYLPDIDKQQAWNDLIKLTTYENIWLLFGGSSILGSVFSYLADGNKQQAWRDLIKLNTSEGDKLIYMSFYTLASAFSHLPEKNKQEAWNDLHKLTICKDRYVRKNGASAIGSAFPYLPDEDKKQAWNDLNRLIDDEDRDVRIYACHSLGKVSIFKASQTEKEEEYKKEFEKAIEFFEKSSQESFFKESNPAQFCLPFYCTFYAIVFRKQEARDEIDKYIAEAKVAIENSKSKEILFEAVENLANALKEVQNLGNKDLEAKKSELDFYRKYCNNAAELLRDAEETTPFATAAMRKGLPILDRKLKSLIEEIKNKAEVAYQVSQGTPTQELAYAVSKGIQKWEIGSQEDMTFYIENLIFALESIIPRVPQNQTIFDKIQQIRKQKDLAKQYMIISTVIPLIPTTSMEQKIYNLEKRIEDLTISFSESKTDVVVSFGIDYYGNGIKINKTMPLSFFSKTEREEIEGKDIRTKTKLVSFSPNIINKVKNYLSVDDN